MKVDPTESIVLSTPVLQVAVLRKDDVHIVMDSDMRGNAIC